MSTAHSRPLPTMNHSKAPYKMLYFGWRNSCMHVLYVVHNDTVPNVIAASAIVYRYRHLYIHVQVNVQHHHILCTWMGYLYPMHMYEGRNYFFFLHILISPWQFAMSMHEMRFTHLQPTWQIDGHFNNSLFAMMPSSIAIIIHDRIFQQLCL